MSRLLAFATLLLLFSCSGSEDSPQTPTPSLPIDPEVSIINTGANAWVFTEIKGNDATSSLNEPNATITLKVGVRYRFFNLGGPTHPLDFRDADGGLLLTQDDETGSFEEDEEVDFEINLDEDLVAFTLTEELAEVLETYNCSVHSAMVGQIDLRN